MEQKKPTIRKRTPKKAQKKQENDNFFSDITVYILDERSGQCLLMLNGINPPLPNDHLVLRKDGYIFEMTVVKRTFVVDSEDSVMAWNIFVNPIGSPIKVEVKEQETKEPKQNDNGELLN